jgi:hypothetical protein
VVADSPHTCVEKLSVYHAVMLSQPVCI